MRTRLASTAIVLSFLPSSLYAAAIQRLPCPSGQHWVNAHHQRAYIRADGTPVTSADVRAHCQNNPPSYSIWANRIKNGVPPHWEKNEKTKPWTDDERERVLEAIAALPDNLLNMPPQNIYRLAKSNPTPENSAAGHDNDIALYDPAFNGSQNLSRVLAHELAHKLYNHFTESEAKAYNSAAEWVVARTASGKRVFVPRMGGFVEEDGTEGPNEDFSNNIEYFLFNPIILHEKTPEVYDWIQRKYGKTFQLRRPEK